MTTPHQLHNDLAQRFILDVVGPAIKGGASFGDLMVLFETCQLGVMDVLCLHYKLRPDVTAGLMEAAHHRALERFAGRNP